MYSYESKKRIRQEYHLLTKRNIIILPHNYVEEYCALRVISQQIISILLQCIPMM